MLITKADKEDKAAILRLWQEYFAFDDGGYTAYYFSDGYDQAKTYVLKEQGQIISCLSVNHGQMIWRDTVIDYDFIVGVITIQEQQRKGYMRKLFAEVFEDLTSPLVLIEGYNPRIYYPFGFQPLYRRKIISVRPPEILHGYEFKKNPEAIDLLEAYQAFTADKQGYRIKDLAYYERLLKLAKAQGQGILAGYVNGAVEGYLIYHQGSEVLVEEIVYSQEAGANALMSNFADFPGNIRVRLMKDDVSLASITTTETGEFLTLAKVGQIDNDDLLKELSQEKKLYFNELG